MTLLLHSQNVRGRDGRTEALEDQTRPGHETVGYFEKAKLEQSFDLAERPLLVRKAKEARVLCAHVPSFL